MSSRSILAHKQLLLPPQLPHCPACVALFVPLLALASAIAQTCPPPALQIPVPGSSPIYEGRVSDGSGALGMSADASVAIDSPSTGPARFIISAVTGNEEIKGVRLICRFVTSATGGD